MFFKTTSNITYNSLKNEYPEYYDTIMDQVKEEDITVSERIWLYQNNLTEKPECLNCDNKVSFIKFYKGYRKYCSRKCAAEHTHKNKSIKQSRIKKMLECNTIEEKRCEMTKKANETKRKFSKKRKEDINDKRNKTVLKKYGVSNISKSEEIKEKISKKLKEKLPKVLLEKTRTRIKDIGFSIVDIDKDNFKLVCPNCSTEFTISRSLFNQRNRTEIEICLNCNPNNNDSFFETSVGNFIQSIYDNEILLKSRKFKTYELDIFLPSENLAFECNGLWWHSENYKEKKYHINKKKFFEEKGIHLIHIWEDDWKYKNDIITSRISNLLNKSTKVAARKCTIREITRKQEKEFLNENHLQGDAISTFRYGLFHNEKLTSIMTFSKLRKNLGRKHKEGEYELLRFCNLKNHQVIGGASRLIKHFVKVIRPESIISYANQDWSSGDLYEKIGFKKIKQTDPNYFYFHKDEGLKLNRFKFRKDKLVESGYDPKMTEHEIMISRGYYRIYDSGSLLYEMRLV